MNSREGESQSSGYELKRSENRSLARTSYGEYGYYDVQPHASGREQVEKVLDLFLRRKWLVLFGFMLVVAATAVYTYTRTPEYMAQSFVSVDLSRRTVLERNPSGVGENLFARNDRTIGGEISLLQISGQLQRRVFQRIRKEAIADTTEGQQTARDIPGGWVEFQPQRGADNIIVLRAHSVEPRHATKLANLYADEYVKLTREASRTYVSALRKSLEEKERERSTELTRVELQIQKYLLSEGSPGLDADGTRVVEQIATLEAERDNKKIDLETAQASLASLEQRIKDISPRLVEQLSSGLEQKIATARDQLSLATGDLEQIYRVNPELRNSDDPRLNAYKTRIRTLQSEVDSLSQEYIDQGIAAGGISVGVSGMGYVATLRQQVTEKTFEIRGLQSQIRVLNGRLARLQKDFEKIPQKAMNMAQLERSRLHAENMYQYIVQRLQSARIAEESEPGYARLLRAAFVPTVPIYPDHERDMILAVFFGLLLGLGLAILRDKMDSRIYQPDQIRGHGLREIGVIPNIEPLIKEDHNGSMFFEHDGKKLSTSLVSLISPVSAASEAYRHIRTFVQFHLRDTILETLLITSPGPQEGKSTIAANLAIVMAQAGKKTLLIDADLRKPSQATLFGLQRKAGLSELLAGEVRESPNDWVTYVDNLSVLTADGSPPSTGKIKKSRDNGVDGLQLNGESAATISSVMRSPSELLGSGKMHRFIKEMKEEFDVVIIDSPPVLVATDSAVLSTQCDATIVVARSAKTKEGELDYAMEIFDDVGATVMGVILNAFDVSMAYGQKYRYQHYGKYGNYSKYTAG